MDTNRASAHTRAVGPLLLTLAATCLLVIACGQAASPPQAPGTPAVELPAATVPPTQPPVVTVTPDLAATATEVDLEEFAAGALQGSFSNPVYAEAATETVRHWNQHLTETALTPTATPWPTRAPTTPEPTATFFVGMITDSRCVRPLSSNAPQFNSCWRTLLGGQWYFVGGGWDGWDRLTPSLMQKSLLLVCPEPCRGLYPADLFRPPWNVGDLRIVSISDGLVTVEPRDPAQHAVFVFDIARRQWLPPAATPTP